MKAREIEQQIGDVCRIYHKLVTADTDPDNELLDEYLAARAALREAIAKWGGKRLIDYLEEV